MAAKHTPGKWSAYNDDGYWKVEVDSGPYEGQTVADLGESSGIYGAPSLTEEDHGEANARLIASAPDMWSALIRAEIAVDPTATADERAKAKAAIRAALGAGRGRLVRHHLALSDTAFKRDLADPRTIRNFVEEVDEPEKLAQLTVLTIVDIRAVGPGIWNGWKRQLLADLYAYADEMLA
jgi:hypothetical protein